MPRRPPKSLPGGRALYRGRDAYAAQGFEDDTRIPGLGGLVQLFLVGNQSIPPGASYTPILWGSYASSTSTTPYLRGFMMDQNGSTLYCRSGGTYRISWTVRVAGLPATRNFLSRLQILRSLKNTRNYYAVDVNPDAALGQQIQQTPASFVIDLLPGDTLILGVQHNDVAVVSVAGLVTSGDVEEFNMTCLSLEQIDR